MMQYWDGKPVRFVCCERRKDDEAADGFPWGRVLWCVALEAVDDEEETEVGDGGSGREEEEE